MKRRSERRQRGKQDRRTGVTAGRVGLGGTVERLLEFPHVKRVGIVVLIACNRGKYIRVEPTLESKRKADAVRTNGEIECFHGVPADAVGAHVLDNLCIAILS